MDAASVPVPRVPRANNACFDIVGGTPGPDMAVMKIQHRVKSALKPLLFDDCFRVRRVKAGPGRGVVALLNRRYDLQREFGLYETELNRAYHKHVRSGVHVIDIGAADGLTSLTYARLGANVTAFEPDALAADKFARNMALNPSLARRITLVQDYYRPGEYPAPGVVKIDVDGAEGEVLRLMPDLPNCVIVETHSRQLESECHELLTARGYAVTIIRNARWRRFYPEYRPIGFNRWLIAVRD
jgi:hypothetical protein